MPQDSGRVTGNLRLPKRYDRRLRRVFSMAALSSLGQRTLARVLRQERRKRLIHTQALLALTRRLIDVL